MLGCYAQGTNYTDPSGPRFAGRMTLRTVAHEPAAAPHRLRVATFNLQMGRNVDGAIALFRGDPHLAQADLIALEEMDEPGVERIADALGLDYVYYPATLHPTNGRNFGNGLLSRWPIVEDRKLILPHLGWHRHIQRAAVVATVLMDDQPVRVYVVHLGTLWEIGPWKQADQLRAVLADAVESPEPTIIVGDFNNGWLADLALEAGFGWPTRDVGTTHLIFSFDHAFVKGLPIATWDAGAVPVPASVSDHRAVWTALALVPRALPPQQASGMP